MEEAVALIELGSSHDECLYAQIKFLQAYGIPVQLIVSGELFERRLDKRHGAERVEVFPAARNRLTEWSLNARVVKFLKGKGIRQAVLNTAHGKGARTLCTLAPRSLELFGIAHNARRLLDWSVTQSLISRRIKQYFVLSDYIADSLRSRRRKRAVSSFYPIYFPMPADAVDSGGRFWIAIPGKPEFKRRDYLGLIEALGATNLRRMCSSWSWGIRRRETVPKSVDASPRLVWTKALSGSIGSSIIRQCWGISAHVRRCCRSCIRPATDLRTICAIRLPARFRWPALSASRCCCTNNFRSAKSFGAEQCFIAKRR